MDTVCFPATTDWGCANPEWLADLDETVRRRSEALAWTTLQAMCGYAFSICPMELRPCRQQCVPPVWLEAPVGSSVWSPTINARGQWVNTCGCGGDLCGCGPLSEILLPNIAGKVVEVLIDGVVLPKTAYRVDNFSHLVRTDGGEWPACQDMSLPTTAVGTFAVRYYETSAPNELDSYAAGVLAKEFALACLGGGNCRLPSGVTSVVRNGVSMEINQNLFLDGSTGIREVDIVIAQRNPNRLKQPSRIASPDSRRGRTTTWGR